MLSKITFLAVLICGGPLPCLADEKPKTKPAELKVLKGYVGTWDAVIEVWPQGPNSPSIKFKGVETIRAFGEHWIASDFDSTFMGKTTTVHSILGYDLDKKQLVGTIIDHGPYKATMTGVHDAKSNTVSLTTRGRTADGKPGVQRTKITQKNPNERVLILLTPGKKKNEFTTMMKIKFVKRK